MAGLELERRGLLACRQGSALTLREKAWSHFRRVEKPHKHTKPTTTPTAWVFSHPFIETATPKPGSCWASKACAESFQRCNVASLTGEVAGHLHHQSMGS